MRDGRSGTEMDYPRFGARARCWHRFECELRAWLDTPEGRFAQWCAGRQVDPAPAAPAAAHTQR